MRLPPSTGALLTLLFLSPPAERQEPKGRAATPAPRANEVELAVEWMSATGPVADSGVWRAGFRVSNRGGGASGPVELRLRTPLGLIAQRQLTVNLAPSESLAATVEVEVVPGLSELCIDIRALDGGRTLPETDSSNNRVCRRLPDRPGDARSSPANRRPEDVP